MFAVEPSPTIIAHRGASGYLPEHTLAAKALAYAQGADYLEQDLVLTKDGALIVQHDVTLDSTTDVAARFPGRQREWQFLRDRLHLGRGPPVARAGTFQS
ncbi:MAG: hypothetical protein CK522_03935 [Opitutia bacterium]|nr:MAG: hypothetical protein CK522_03935 [Opitutae bacterium]